MGKTNKHKKQLNFLILEKSNNHVDYFDIRDLYVNDDYEYFSKSKMTFLLFRKFQENTQRSLELRHQRSGDAVFDFIGIFHLT